MNRTRRVWIVLAWTCSFLLPPSVPGDPASVPPEKLTVDEAVRLALEFNPGLESARHRIDAARAAARQVASAWWPWLSTSAGYARTDNPPQAFMMDLNQRTLDMTSPTFDPNHPGDTDNTRLSLEAHWQIWDFGRTSADRAAAREGALLAEAQAEAARQSLAHEVTAAYCGALRAQAFVAVQDELLASLTESRRVAQTRVEAGAAVRSDVLSLDVRIAQAQEDLLHNRHGVALAVAALNAAIGRPAATADRLICPTSDAVPPLPPPLENPVARRPEWRAATTAAELQRARLDRARRDNYPTLGAFGSLDWDGEDTLGDYEDSYLAGLELRWGAFEGGRRLAAVDGAAAELAAVEAAARDIRNRLALDYQQASLLAEEAHARLAVARANIENAAEALRITRERYETGAADIAELLVAQSGLTAQRTRLVAASYDYRIALSNLARAGGQAVPAPDTGDSRLETP
jgi:outer membrane protein TolC